MSGVLPDAWSMRRYARTGRRGATDSTDLEATMGGADGPEGGGANRLEAAGQEARRAARSLLRAPGFTGASVITLGVGLGATAAIATLVHAILIRPLPYPGAERVVRVQHILEDAGGGNPLARFAYPFLRDASRSFEAFGGYWSPGSYTLGGDGAAERIRGVRATEELFEVLGARPVLGRLLTDEDAALEEASGLVLAHRLWVDRFGSDPEIVGRTIEIDAQSREVLGVVAPDIDLPETEVDLWLPYVVPAGIPADDAFRIRVLARLRPGVDLASADAELDRLTERLPEFGSFYRMLIDDMGLATRARPVRDEVVGAVERPLWILLGAVLIVLLVAAANVATLFLVRAEGRRREVAIRSALGAGRGKLVGHFLAESVWIAAAAGAAGLALAAGAVALFRSLAPATVPRLDEIQLGWPSVAVVAALTLVVALALGFYPYMRFGRPGGEGLRSRTTGESRSQSHAGGGLVVAQVALALVLLAGSGLLVRTFQALRAVDPGFEPEGVLVAEFSVPSASYASIEEVLLFQDRLLEIVQGVPGVRRAALGPSPLGPGGCNGLYVEGMVLAEGQFPPCVPVASVSTGYWDVLGIDLVAGRPLEAADQGVGGPRVAVVSENVARRLWPGGDPLAGGVHPSPGTGPPWFQVVGVAGAVHGRGPDQPATETVYLPMGALADQGWIIRTQTLLVATGTAEGETDLASALRSAVASLDPGVPLTVQGSLTEAQARTMSRSTFTLFLLGTAAATALVLGLVGLYGVVAYRVGRRRAEIGVRMAMGARAAHVRRLVLGHSLRLVAWGTALGLVASLLLTRTLASLLYGVSPGDPGTMVLAAAALVVTALVASWIPAERATRVDPTTALRSEG